MQIDLSEIKKIIKKKRIKDQDFFYLHNQLIIIAKDNINDNKKIFEEVLNTNKIPKYILNEVFKMSVKYNNIEICKRLIPFVDIDFFENYAIRVATEDDFEEIFDLIFPLVDHNNQKLIHKLFGISIIKSSDDITLSILKKIKHLDDIDNIDAVFLTLGIYYKDKSISYLLENTNILKDTITKTISAILNKIMFIDPQKELKLIELFSTYLDIKSFNDVVLNITRFGSKDSVIKLLEKCDIEYCYNEYNKKEFKYDAVIKDVNFIKEVMSDMIIKIKLSEEIDINSLNKIKNKRKI